MSNFFSISDPVFLSQENMRGNPHCRPIVLCDFDGTISLVDVTDTLLNHFGQDGCDELEALWCSGQIGSQECMSKQIALLDASFDELNSVLAKIKIDPFFKAFVQFAQKNHIDVHIVSDGLDYAIQSILANNGLAPLPVYANELKHDNQRGWKLQFPYSAPDCEKASGNCKCAHVKKQRQTFSPIFYVGDGTSDFCVSNKVDYVFAKDKLIHFCQQHKINHSQIADFSHVIELMPTLLSVFDHSFTKQPNICGTQYKSVISL
ncbi:hypothetical protein GCM10023211_24220 [Orbus sasakiae]|uniref:Phosphatase n=1 Tax=Orbus sasakiae TaxID=1078475 RepID=A0ABP9NFY7_9GAMM